MTGPVRNAWNAHILQPGSIRNRKHTEEPEILQKKNIFLNWWKSHNSLQEKKHVKLLLLFPNQQKNKIFKGKLYENVEPKHFPGALASSIPFRCPPARMAATWTCCLALWIGWQTTCNEQTCFHTCWSNVYIYIYIIYMPGNTWNRVVLSFGM